MYRFAAPAQLNDYFTPLPRRTGQSVYFCRLAARSPETDAFLQRYYETARTHGVILDGRLGNPTPANLSYYNEIMGPAFSAEQAFLQEALRKWLPRMGPLQNRTVAEALYAVLQEMSRAGKTADMQKNACMKFLCWLYYKFERITGLLGGAEPPKILYAAEPSGYELQMLTILSRSGADILLLERGGDDPYRKIDPGSVFSTLYTPPGGTPFPADFSLRQLQKQEAPPPRREAPPARPAQRNPAPPPPPRPPQGRPAASLTVRAPQGRAPASVPGRPAQPATAKPPRQPIDRKRLLRPEPSPKACTNAWIKSPELAAVQIHARNRGDDPNLFCNAFLCQYGAEDGLTYMSELFGFYQSLKGQGRTVCVVDKGIPAPTPDEISTVRRSNARTPEELAAGLALNIVLSDRGAQDRVYNRFIECVLDEAEKEQSLPRLTSRAVYVLCWLQRYAGELFCKSAEPPVFILFGTCATEAEAMFLRCLAGLPVDVVVLVPDLSAACCLADARLLELKKAVSFRAERFPQEQSRVGTAAYEAERQLDTLLYQDSGLYRSHQHDKAEAVTLRVTYDEIGILWDETLTVRPNFAVNGGVVTMPVLMEKVCGVKDGRTDAYWSAIRRLCTPDTTLIRRLPWINSLTANPIKPRAVQFLRRGRLDRQAIKRDPAYPYSILREEIQNHILDKLQLLLDQRLIRGTYENGTEYTVIATALNLEKSLVQQIQRFDFTKKNPKLVFVLAGEQILSLEDSITVALLNLIGYDIVFFVPTGYQCIEKHFARPIAEEQQLGEYLYDLQVPDIAAMPVEKTGFMERLFGRSRF